MDSEGEMAFSGVILLVEGGAQLPARYGSTSSP